MAVLPPQSFTLETERFLVRPFLEDDASPALENWNTDPTAAEMLNMPLRQKWPVVDQAKYFGRSDAKQGGFLLGIFPKQERDAIGAYKLKLQPASGTFVITHFIGTPAWRRQHVTTETSEAVYDYLFNKLDYKKAKANVRPQNRPILWLMLRGGWHKEAHLVRHLRDANTGERGDILVLGMLADEWRMSLADSARSGLVDAPKPPVQKSL